MQITYEDGGPSYHVNNYFPHLHYQAAAVLTDEDYDELINWGTKYDYLESFRGELDTIEKLLMEGAVENISYLGNGIGYCNHNY